MGDTSGSVSNSPDPQQMIREPDKDIAVNEHLEKITVGVMGRVQSQKIYVSTPNGKRSILKYDPSIDAPDQEMSILPTREEIEGRPETSEYLIVGFVLAKDPYEFSTRGLRKSRDRARDEARIARGVHPPQANILRAVVPVTEHINPANVKYYVTCRPEQGLCQMRVTTSDAIFFFSEIWAGISDGTPIKRRRTLLGAACRKAAAKVQGPPEEPAVTPAETLTLSNLPSTTPQTETPEDIRAGSIADERVVDGKEAFYSFDIELTYRDAEAIIEQLEEMHPNICTLDEHLIVETHAVMRKEGLGSELPYESFALFLKWMHDRASTRWGHERLAQVVQQILRDIEDACNLGGTVAI